LPQFEVGTSSLIFDQKPAKPAFDLPNVLQDADQGLTKSALRVFGFCPAGSTSNVDLTF
tara:strand:+ start:4703 stop:4879 length:177 start_codon:yes stop_codon:yes gene_type:complete